MLASKLWSCLGKDENSERSLFLNLHIFRLWLNTEGNKATGNALEKALKQCDRQDIVNKCMFNIEMVTDNAEQEVAQSVLAREEGYKETV